MGTEPPILYNIGDVVTVIKTNTTYAFERRLIGKFGKVVGTRVNQHYGRVYAIDFSIDKSCNDPDYRLHNCDRLLNNHKGQWIEEKSLTFAESREPISFTFDEISVLL